MTKTRMLIGRLAYPEHFDRPCHRGDCDSFTRPCPFVGCKYNLYLDVNSDTGSIKFNFPDVEPGEMIESCTLDVADRGEHTLEDVAAMMNITRERVRQVEEMGLEALADSEVAKTNWSGEEAEAQMTN